MCAALPRVKLRRVVRYLIISILLAWFLVPRIIFFINPRQELEMTGISSSRSEVTISAAESSHNMTSSQKLRTAIFLKLPRTGSSWLTETLNSFPQIFLSKEIIQRSDLRHFSEKDKQIHLQSALRFPKDKISTSGFFHIGYSGRFFNDFISNYKFAVRLRVLGFTLNPEYVSDVTLRRVLDSFPDTKVIVLRRRNVVKMAVSGGTGKLIFNSYGLSNLKKEMNPRNKISLDWNYSQFMDSVKQAKMRYASFLDKIDALGADYHEIYYEDMQTDFSATLQKLFDYLGCRGLRWPEFLLKNSTNFHAKILSEITDGWQKRTPDNLSHVLIYYKDIKKQLVKLIKKTTKDKRKRFISDSFVSSEAALKCILEQLESTDSKDNFLSCNGM